MTAHKTAEKDCKQQGVSRRGFLKTAACFTLCWGWTRLAQSQSTEEVPPEPENLDEPTAWQEGDPEPVEMTVPAQEPEQTSNEAPPSQPMDDDRGNPPGPDYVWVMGYWWWTSGQYVWVPGYWAFPPQPSYVYVAGYWTYRDVHWVYIRGGWAKPNTTVIVVYPDPRPVLTLFVITAPIRIARRHRRWRHHHSRRIRHRPRPKPRPKAKPRPRPRPKPKPKPRGKPGGPVTIR